MDGDASPALTATPLLVSVGIEGTFEPVSGKDTLVATGHFSGRRWSEDLALVRGLGLAEVRYPIRWHDIERDRGRYAWDSLDSILQSAHDEHGISIIADPLHHTSYPCWLEGGFLDPRFPSAYVRFVEAFVERYPQIRVFTPFNEPTCTLDFCGWRGIWHPHRCDTGAYVTMLRHTARATAEAIHTIRAHRSDAHILHVDTFERHVALDRQSEPRARFLNERRFLFDELLSGRVGERHPLYGYLLENGFGDGALAWHAEHPARIDERGGNYYPLNEEELVDCRTYAAPSQQPVGLAAVVREYAERLPYPLSLTETNICGTIRDRISWLKYVLQEVETLAGEGRALHRFAWYPLFDCCGWGSLLQAPEWSRDLQGIFSCDDDWSRRENEFSRVYRAVAAGLRSDAIPAYAFTSIHDRTLGPLKAHMSWDWVR
jgi:beta-glucosidase